MCTHIICPPKLHIPQWHAAVAVAVVEDNMESAVAVVAVHPPLEEVEAPVEFSLHDRPFANLRRSSICRGRVPLSFMRRTTSTTMARR
jgi:hypothetical protein